MKKITISRPENAIECTIEALAKKTYFTPNLLLPGDVVETPDEFDLSYFIQGREFLTKRRNEQGILEEVMVRGNDMLCEHNGVQRYLPLGSFMRCRNIVNTADYIVEASEVHRFNLELLACDDQLQAAKLLCGKTLKVVGTFKGKFQRFDKGTNKPIEDEFDIKMVPLFKIE